MPALFSVSITGGEAVKQGLAALATSIKDLRPFWRDVFAPKYFEIVQDLFATGGRARGGGGKFKTGAWAGLEPTYRVWKQLHYPGQPILVREGTLRESVRWTGQVGPGGIFEAEPSYAIAGTTIGYGKYHMTGTSRMPARPFLPPPDPAVFGPLLLQWLLKAQKV